MTDGRFRLWTRQIAVVGLAQIVVQAIGFAAGIVVLRVLSVHEYALYTIALGMLGTMTVLADSGVEAGVMASAGKVWQDRDALGRVYSTGLRLRVVFASLSAITGVPITLFLLRKHEASWIAAAVIAIALVPAFISALSGKLLEVPVKLHQDVVAMQRNQIGAGVVRLALLVALVIALPFAAVAIACSGAAQVWANLRLRTVALRYVQPQHASDPVVRREILRVVRRTMPSSVYYAVAGQTSIWLLSIFGTTTSLAQVGALSRLTAVLTIALAVFGMLVVPRFSRLPPVRQILLRRYGAVHATIAIGSVVMMAPFVLLPNALVWLLGPDYAGLQDRLALAAAGAVMGVAAGAAFGLDSSRGYVPNPLLALPLVAGAQVVFMLLLPVSTLTGVLVLTLVVNFVAYLLSATYGAYRITRIQSMVP